ncbi:HK97 gp10 family phage protein [Spirosoma fluminis]
MLSWSGLKSYKAKLRRGPSNLKVKSKRDVERWGRGVESGGKQDAPVDLGKLRQSISYEPIDNGMGARVSVNEPYAAFIEFGTGAGVIIPPGWDEVAAKFKGSGMRKVTITAQPFLTPNVRSENEKLKNRLRYNLRTFLQ